MYEKTFLPSYMIPTEDGTGRNITLLALISECGYLKDLNKETNLKILNTRIE